MEKLKAQHDHSLTDILKVFIFTLFLVLPGLMFLPTMFYYGFNEHAQANETVIEGGYEVRNKYETNEVQTAHDIILGNIYYMDTLGLDTEVVTGDFIITFYKYSSLIYEALDGVMQDEIITEYYDSNSSNGLEINVYEGYAYVFFTNNNTYASFEMDTSSFNFEEVYFVVHSGLENFINFLDDIGYAYDDVKASDYSVVEYVYNEEHEVVKHITQMLDQNWHDLWQTDMFKWTNTSILKQGLDNFTNAFGVSNTSNMTNLITYELIMVGIYVVIDIVISLFKWLTHLIGTK